MEIARKSITRIYKYNGLSPTYIPQQVRITLAAWLTEPTFHMIAKTLIFSSPTGSKNGQLLIITFIS